MLTLLLFSVQSLAASISVTGPCDSAPIFSAEHKVRQGESVGAFTVRSFEAGGLEFVGAEHGINSIQGSPTGMEAMEIISREEMRSYGWCFEHNGKVSDKYPDELTVTGDSDQVHWFFGYAHYLRGQWLSMCNPSWKRKPDFLCQKR